MQGTALIFSPLVFGTRTILLLLLTFAPLISNSRTRQTEREQAFINQAVIVGAERLNEYQALLQGKQVGFVVNHTSQVGDQYLIDTLFRLGITIARIFAPEHGFRGDADAGDEVKDGKDSHTGALITSLYGTKQKPSPADLAGLDMVVFDIQDVGARFYTYISTMYYVMEACAEQGKPLLILDRPNPNGHLIDGPVLVPEFKSFVGIAPIPIAHGCTVGELALMFKGEAWIKQADALQLTIISCQNYAHHIPYNLPIKPSPNLPTMRAVLLYPSLCLFEGSTCSVGRGTDWPFEVIGHPDFGDKAFTFIPRPNEGNKYPLHERWVCKGRDFRGLTVDSLRQRKQLNLSILLNFYREFPNKPAFFIKNNFFDLLAGTDQLRLQILSGKTEKEIRESWKAGLDVYKAIREKYLLYK